LLFGVVPALQASGLDVNNALKASGSRASGSKLSSRVRGVLIITEVALSLVLLIGATLLIRSFVKLRGVELGFDPNNVTTMQVSLNSDRYASSAQVWDLERRVAERLSALPGVTAVGTVPSLPMERGLRDGATILGSHGEERITIQYRTINADYFRALGIKVSRGREFTDADLQSTARVAIINETLARRFWPGEDPVGRPLTSGTRGRQILGVVSDIKEMGANQPALPTVYIPTTHVTDDLASALNRWFLTSWIIRTAEPIKNDDALRQALKDIDPDLPVARVRPMTEVVSGTLTEQRFTMTMMTAFAALAVLLTVVALYGVLSYQAISELRRLEFAWPWALNQMMF
jgi:predicted permease